MSSWLCTTKQLFSSNATQSKTPQTTFAASHKTLVITKSSSFPKRKEKIFLPICFWGIKKDLADKHQVKGRRKTLTRSTPDIWRLRTREDCSSHRVPLESKALKKKNPAINANQKENTKLHTSHSWKLETRNKKVLLFSLCRLKVGRWEWHHDHIPEHG